MAREEISAWNEIPAYFVDYCLLSRLIEIDQDITEEHYVEHLPDAVILIHEVQPVEGHLSTKFRNHPHQALRLVATLPKVSPAKLRRHRGRLRFVVDSLSRQIQHSSGDVGTQNRVIEPGLCHCILTEHHCEGVRLFPRRAAGGPDR